MYAIKFGGIHVDIHKVVITKADIDKVKADTESKVSRIRGQIGALQGAQDAQDVEDFAGDFCTVYNGGLKAALELAQTIVGFFNSKVATAIGLVITALDKACAA